MYYLLSLAFVLFPTTTQALTIDCLNKATQKKYISTCRRVLDLTKLEHQEVSYINCTGELGDGYEVQRCNTVDVFKQRRQQALLTNKEVQ